MCPLIKIRRDPYTSKRTYDVWIVVYNYVWFDSNVQDFHATPIVKKWLMETIRHVTIKAMFADFIPANAPTRPHIDVMPVRFKAAKELTNTRTQIPVHRNDSVVAIEENVHEWHARRID